MTRARIFDSFAWILLGLLLGACVGALITFAHQAASLEAFGILKGMAVGAVLGSLGGMVVVSTKAAILAALVSANVVSTKVAILAALASSAAILAAILAAFVSASAASSFGTFAVGEWPC